MELENVYTEPHIALDCPYCKEPIYATLSWFKQAYFTCPNCDKGLADGQFAVAVTALEDAMDASIEEMINGQTGGGCCGSQRSCGGGCS